jgi:pyruvate dehydrogenase E2 component (dihydrolipoamide acetyltransferase)
MDLKLPLLGDIMTEGTLAEWLRPSGALVDEGAPLYQLETDKVSLTVEAPVSGVLEQLVRAGETVPVGTVVGRLGETRVPIVAGRATEQVRATPAARALARQNGVDLTVLAGTLGDRRIREADVQAFSAPLRPVPAPPPETLPAPPVPPASVEGVLLSGRRKVIAERMRSSLQQTAQLTISMEVDMTRALELRAQLLQLLPEPAQPTITDLVMRATTLALHEHPQLNATFVDGRVMRHADVHIGLAVDVEDGLIVPVVRHAGQMTLAALAAETKQLAVRARDNRLQLDELQGATFTVTSLGPLGVDFFTPIVNAPQVAILGIGRLYSKLALEHGQPVERQALYLNLSFDHQVVDGAPAARFLQSTKRHLEVPASLILQPSVT